MARARIYDAQFASGTGREHHHLAKFWWVDGTGKTGTWTRKQAFDYVVANPGDVYVSEAGYEVAVMAYRDKASGVEWIQTVADGVLRDNLTTLAIRHAQGLPNT